MTYGLDTTFVVQVDVVDHERHAESVGLRDRLLVEGHSYALAPQVLAEYVHIVTDSNLFAEPASMKTALEHSRMWWNSAEIRQIIPSDDAVQLLHTWMTEHGLGRKRILDALLAATYATAGITAIISSDARDYSRFFETVVLS